MKRIITILHTNENAYENVQNLVKTLTENMCADCIFVATKEPHDEFNIFNGT
jgi:hypothetical protein